MKLLTVPNWSFGRDRGLKHRFREILEIFDLEVHYVESDVDHNRTVSAFTGESGLVFEALLTLAHEALPCIDLNRHVGVHPRIGALDVCPFALYDERDLEAAKAAVEEFGSNFAKEFQMPVFLYERSEKGRHEADLPSLRRGGFGSLTGKTLIPDFGPTTAHSRWGVTVMGVRGFLIALNVDLEVPEPLIAKKIAAEIRAERSDGNEMFLGVRALGFPLASRELSQVSINLTLPDITAVDPILDWIRTRAEFYGVGVNRNELIGVIRQQDRLSSGLLPAQKSQVIPL